jgi:hypothetical protein
MHGCSTSSHHATIAPFVRKDPVHESPPDRGRRRARHRKALIVQMGTNAPSRPGSQRRSARRPRWRLAVQTHCGGGGYVAEGLRSITQVVETLHHCPVEPDQTLASGVDLAREAYAPKVDGRDDSVGGFLGDGYASHTEPPSVS